MIEGDWKGGGGGNGQIEETRPKIPRGNEIMY